MRRPNRIDEEWVTPKSDFNWEHVAIEVLMDIRAQLRTLNKTLSCYRVIEMADACRSHRSATRGARGVPAQKEGAMSDRDIVERLREDAAVTASSASAWLEREAAEEIERLRAEHDRYRAALQTIAADRCRFCGAITETPCRHEGMWLKCERRGSATYWDDVAAKQVAQEALKELKEPAPCS